MALCKLLVACSGAASFQAHGARLTRHESASQVDSKFIAGVPVLNYHKAYDGAPMAILAEGVKGKWIVVTKPTTSDDEIQQMCSSDNCGFIGHPDEGGVPAFSLEATESDLEAMLTADGDKVEFVEPDSTVSKGPVIEDEDEVGIEAATWGLNRIGADSKSRNGRGTHIYVLDTGVRHTHTQFSGRAVPGIDVTSGRVQTCSSSSSTCARDRDGHGTHCAGTAAGRSFGVATGARVYGAKVLGDDGYGQLSWSQAALDWIATRGSRPRVASMSLGGSGTSSSDRRAVDRAVAAGVSVVVAAGNENDNACRYTPAFVTSAITVGSTTSRDARSGFSNYGSCVNIWAPGSNVKSASHRSDTRDVTFSGTSMACPHVSGAAALALQANPGWSSDRVLRRMHDVSERGKISGLKSGDTNRFLNIRGQ